MANDMDLYDQEELDQEATVKDGADKAEKEGAYESFLAPKSAFPAKSLNVGEVHRVKIDRLLDEEVQMHCVDSDEPENTDNASEESDEMYT